jgi:hypothetical protein
MKEGKEDDSHMTGGRAPYKLYKNRKSQGNAHTLMLPDQFFGETHQNVQIERKESVKIDVTSPYTTAALSADIPKCRCSTLLFGPQIMLQIGEICRKYEAIKAEGSSESFKIKAYGK